MSATLFNGLNINMIDTAFMLYLTPELKQIHNITTVEGALQYYMDNGNMYNDPAMINDFVVNKQKFLENFDDEIYYFFYKNNILNDNYIDDAVRDSILNDKKRLSIIHYYRVGRGNYDVYNKTCVDSKFNPYLYKVAHNITQNMTDKEAYVDYLQRLQTNEGSNVIIGNVDDLAYRIGSNVSIGVNNLIVDDTLVVKDNLVVYKNSIINGNVISEGTGLEINGGTLMIDNKYGNLDMLFGQSALSSKAITFEQSEIRHVKGESDEGDELRVIGANFAVTSNMVVEDTATFRKNVLIGNDLVADTSYSLQTEKKIRIEGADVTSDRRLKTNIQKVDIDDCLEKIRKLNVCLYDKQRRTAGVIADEVRTIVPDAVSTGTGLIKCCERSTATSECVLKCESDFELGEVIHANDLIHIQNMTTLRVHRCVVIAIEDKSIHIESSVLNVNDTYTVSKYVDDMLSVDYTQLFVYLIGAVQKLAEIISSN